MSEMDQSSIKLFLLVKLLKLHVHEVASSSISLPIIKANNPLNSEFKYISLEEIGRNEI